MPLIRRIRSVTLILGIALLTGCNGDGGTSPTTRQLVGTWVLLSVDGIEAPPGTLTWTISSTTITADSGPDDCVEVVSYTVSGNRITLTTTSLSGSGCGGVIGEKFEFTFDVRGDTVTVVITDPDLGTATFVFRRV